MTTHTIASRVVRKISEIRWQVLESKKKTTAEAVIRAGRNLYVKIDDTTIACSDPYLIQKGKDGDGYWFVPDKWRFTEEMLDALVALGFITRAEATAHWQDVSALNQWQKRRNARDSLERLSSEHGFIISPEQREALRFDSDPCPKPDNA